MAGIKQEKQGYNWKNWRQHGLKDGAEPRTALPRVLELPLLLLIEQALTEYLLCCAETSERPCLQVVPNLVGRPSDRHGTDTWITVIASSYLATVTVTAW